MQEHPDQVIENFSNNMGEVGKRIVDAPGTLLVWAEDHYARVAGEITARYFAERMFTVIELLPDGDRVVEKFNIYARAMRLQIPTTGLDPFNKAVLYLEEFIKDSDKRLKPRR